MSLAIIILVGTPLLTRHIENLNSVHQSRISTLYKKIYR